MKSSSSAPNFLLIAANAIAAHKTQGSTFSRRVIVNLGQRESLGVSFVSSYRVTKWENLFIISFTYERYSKLVDTPYFSERASVLERIIFLKV